MGRLPATFAGKLITARLPYEMYGELSIDPGSNGVQYPPATFQNGVDKPFEIHRVIPRIYAVDAEGAIIEDAPSEEVMQAFIKLSMLDTSLDYQITKNPTRVSAMTKGSSENTWEWADPHYLLRSNGIQVTVDADATNITLDSFLVCLTFQGFLCIVAPASEDR